MASSDRRTGLSGRWPRLLGLSARWALAICAAMVFPPVFNLLVPETLVRTTELVLAVLALAYGAARVVARFAPSSAAARRVGAFLGRVDLASAFALKTALPALLFAACLAMLAAWAPHYLLWPWHRDTDTFALLAQSWDVGVLPYRDIRAYNFPGAIYEHWALGKVFGWGKTWPFNLADAAGLVALGAVLWHWSRRRLGGPVPGLAAYFIFLTFYLGLHFTLVAQRDWHATLGTVLAVLVLETWPGRAGRAASAFLTALAMALRPHAVVFLPALIAAVIEGAHGRAADDDQAAGDGPEGMDRPGRERARSDGPAAAKGAKTGRAVCEWLLELGAFVALWFAPLVLAGIADDFFRGLKLVAWGGPYNRRGPTRIVSMFLEQLIEPKNQAMIGLLVAALIVGRGGARRLRATWALAVAGALCYRLFHPVQHFYLIHPWELVGTIALAPSMAWILEGRRWPAPRLFAVLLLIVEANLGVPRYCEPMSALRALRSIARGETLPERPPPGAAPWFGRMQGRFYSWPEYRDVLRYIRAATGRETLVANVLDKLPYPSINGPTGRLSPLLAESGICWMLFVDLDIEPEFAEALRRARDAVVVWSPTRSRDPSQIDLERLARAIRAHYRLEARFGEIEVWRRRGAIEGEAADTSAAFGPKRPAVARRPRGSALHRPIAPNGRGFRVAIDRRGADPILGPAQGDRRALSAPRPRLRSEAGARTREGSGWTIGGTCARSWCSRPAATPGSSRGRCCPRRTASSTFAWPGSFKTGLGPRRSAARTFIRFIRRWSRSSSPSWRG